MEIWRDSQHGWFQRCLTCNNVTSLTPNELGRVEVLPCERCSEALAERDAARQEAESLAQRGIHDAQQIAALDADIHDLTEQRDAVRETAGRYCREIAGYISRVKELEKEAGALRSQVATLEADLSNVRRLHGKAILDGSAAVTRAEEAERRVRNAADRLTGLVKGPDRKDPLELETAVDEAERRVAELETALRDVRDWASGDAGPHVMGTEDYMAGWNEARAHVNDTLPAAPATHPAPAGLLEAVGQIRAIADAIEQEAPLCAGHLRIQCDSLLAAYDAAKGGETREEGDLAGLLTLLAQPTTDTLLRVETEGELLFSVDGGELHEMAAAARKYREACERAKDRDTLLVAYDEAEPAADLVKEDEGWARDAGRVDAVARYVLHGNVDIPPSGPGGGEDSRGFTITVPDGTPGFEPALNAPPAPDVVMEVGDVTVYADGTWSDTGTNLPHVAFVDTLARALAEAKREEDSQRRQKCESYREAKTLEDAALKAAEAMRERAAKEAHRLATAGVGGVEGHKTGVAIERAIRALPME